MKPRNVVLAIVTILVLASLAVWIARRQVLTPGTAAGSFEDDLAALREVDPALVLYEEDTSLDPCLGTLHALAVGPDDRVYVAGDDALVVMESDGALLRRIALGRPATCLALDSEGILFVGFRDAVQAFDAEGRPATAWRVPEQKAYLTCVAVSDGNIYAADAANKLVWRFGRDGGPPGRIGGTASGHTFVVPSPFFALAVDGNEDLWVVDPGRHEFRNYRPDGELVSSWRAASTGIEGFCGCCNPTHFAVRADGSFVTSEKGLERVKVYGPAGEFVGVVAGPESFDEGTTGLDVAVDGAGRVLVLDPARGTVRVFVEK